MAGSARAVEREPRIRPKYTRPFSSRDVGSGNETNLKVATDDLYQKIAQKLNRNYFFSLRSIRINTVLHYELYYNYDSQVIMKLSQHAYMGLSRV